jgi:hypothetical protein
MRRRSYTTVLLLFLVIAGSLSPVLAQIVNQNLRLHVDKAIYGMSGKGSDVTLRVRSMIRNNSLDFKVNNTNLGGDPNKGTNKTLKLTYTYGARRMSKIVNEGDRCRIP